MSDFDENPFEDLDDSGFDDFEEDSFSSEETGKILSPNHVIVIFLSL